MQKTNAGLNILTIEDNCSDLYLVEHMLGASSLAIGHLYSADRVKDACVLLKKYPIDLVLLDLTLPDSFGIDSFSHSKSVVQKIPVSVYSVTIL